MWPSNSALRCIHKGIESLCLLKNLYRNVYKNITDNNQNVIAIQVSINQCMDKQNVV